MGLQEASPHVCPIPETDVFSSTPHSLANYPSQVRTSGRISRQSRLPDGLLRTHFRLKESTLNRELGKPGKVHTHDINLQFARARKVPGAEALEMAQTWLGIWKEVGKYPRDCGDIERGWSKVQIFSDKMNRAWGSNVKRGDYS